MKSFLLLLVLIFISTVDVSGKVVFPVGSSDQGLFEGDIRLTSQQEKIVKAAIKRGGSIEEGDGKGTSGFGLTNVYPPWDNGVVIYTFASSITSNPSKKRGIYAAMKEWTSKTGGCITFRERTNERNYLEFFVGNGCWGHLGKPNGKSQISVGRGCEGQNVMAHEIGHALGFWHEQSRTDRDSYIKILWENVPAQFKEAFAKYGKDKIDSLGVPYDYTSIMHYPWNAFSTTGRDTVKPLRTVPHPGPYVGISQLDVKQAKLFYKCGNNPVNTRQPPVTRCVTETRDVVVRNNANCRDSNRNCRSWASTGECTRNPRYMKTSCCASCGGSCRDKDNRCRAWASRGECRRNPAYMNVNCKQSCNKCSTTKEVTTKRCYTLPPPKTTTTDLIPPIPVTTNPIPPIPMTTDPLPTIPMTTDPIPPIPVVTTAVPPSVVTTEGVVIPPIPPTQEPTIKPQPPPTPDDCKMTEKYGISNPLIVTDEMLTSSSSDNRWSTARFGRLGTRSNEISVGAWCAAYQDKNQYLQIEIKDGAMIGGLIVQGRDTDKGDNSLHKFVKFFKLAWKKDDQTPWTNVDFVFATNLSDGTREQKVEFEVPIVAKYLKVIPEEWQHQTCMRIELLKCTKA